MNRMRTPGGCASRAAVILFILFILSQFVLSKPLL